MKLAKVERFMELYRENARVNGSTLLQKDTPSLLSCTHACMINTGCGGMVYCDVDTRLRCELLSQHTIKEDYVFYSKKCSIYLVQKIFYVGISVLIYKNNKMFDAQQLLISNFSSLRLVKINVGMPNSSNQM